MQSTPITRYFLVFLLSLLTLTVTTTPAGAQTAPAMSYAFTVNTTADTHDAKPGDGVCADSMGHCSLRAAIEEADALPSGSSITIMVPKGIYALTLGTLGLTANTITITGASRMTTIVKGNHTFGIMSISPKMSVFLSQLTIEGGSALNGGYGDGISNSGTLSVSTSTISRNSTVRDSGGGGIYNTGTLSVSNSTISNNMTGGSGGGIENIGGKLSVSNTIFSNNSAPGSSGGGILNDTTGTLSVSNSTFNHNSANSGGGIDNSGTATVINSTFSRNSANFIGGLGNNGGTLTVKNSTFSGNFTSYGGGGIENGGGGMLSVSNSTISGNSAANLGGGGIENDYNGTVSVTTSTISGNSAPNGGGVDNAGSTVTLTGTIVANSKGGSNCAGTITDKGYNLDSGSSCGFSLSSDLNNTDPMLGPLKNNGGPTKTMALLQGSKAIDWVAVSSCPATDQRGYMRPDGSGESMCDIGAYESAY